MRKRGHRTLTKTFSRVTLAKQWIQETELALERGRLFTGGDSLGDIIDRFRIEIVEPKPYRVRMASQYQRLARELRDVRLNEMTAEWWLSWYRGLDCAPASRQRYATILASALRTAEAFWDAHPDWAAYKKAKLAARKTGLLSAGRSRDRRPAPGEIERIKAVASGCVPLGDFIDFSLATGMRCGEICRLLWDDVDHSKRMVLVRDRKHPSAKMGNHWNVPLLGEAYPVLARQPRTSVRVFPYLPNTVGRLFRDAAARAGVKGLRLHDLRHEAISRLFEQGYSIQEVSLVSGHADWGSLRIYTQLRPEGLHDGPLAKRKPHEAA